MLLYNKQDRDIYNLDTMIRIYPDDECLKAFTTSGNVITIACCDSDAIPPAIIEDIYKKMTYGSENMILDLEEYGLLGEKIYKEEEAKKDVNEEK